MSKIRVSGRVLDDHKGPTIEVPFNPVERWGISPEPISPGQRGHRVSVSLNGGESFESAIVPRTRKFFLLLDDEKLATGGVSAGDRVKLTVEPLELANQNLGADRPPSDELIGLLAETGVEIGELALRLRELLLKLAPTASEVIFRSYATGMIYSLTSNWMDGFCHIVVYPRHVNLGFAHGVDLDDPAGVLLGSGKLIRHIKLTKPEDVKKSYLPKYIRQAIKNSQADIAARRLMKSEEAKSKSKSKKR